MFVQAASQKFFFRNAFGGVFTSLWHNRYLVLQLVRREFEGRFRGSLLGVFWSLLTPLSLLVVYTFVFSQVFKARWSVEMESPVSFALVLFSGLIAFNIFSENFNAAPRFVLQNPAFVKKVVFPLEILPWVGLLNSLVTAVISSILLLIFYIFTFGLPSTTALFVPLIFLPLCLFTLGTSWFLASLGVFLRDIQHSTSIVSMLLMFLSPIFYPLSAVPASVQKVIMFNPLTVILEMIRGAVFFQTPPNLIALLSLLLLSWLFAGVGYWWFVRTKKGFADVI